MRSEEARLEDYNQGYTDVSSAEIFSPVACKQRGMTEKEREEERCEREKGNSIYIVTSVATWLIHILGQLNHIN